MTKPLDQPLRPLSPRPTVVVSDRQYSVVDPTRLFIGKPFPIGRPKIVTALPTGGAIDGAKPVQVVPYLVVKDGGNERGGDYLADPNGVLIGFPAVHVHRMLTARWTQDTRRLAG